ncbi:hypothetical protein PMAYCL1PPCAC_08413, partial [Pristionchus mayeri]
RADPSLTDDLPLDARSLSRIALGGPDFERIFFILFFIYSNRMLPAKAAATQLRNYYKQVTVVLSYPI